MPVQKTSGGERLGVAIIGLGRIAWRLEDDPLREKPASHAGAVALNPDTVLLAGCDLEDENRKAFSEKYSVPTYATAEDMFLAHKPDLVIIAADSEEHAGLCHLCLDRSIKVLLCEKPLALTVDEARSVVKRARKKNIPVLINHERRYSADYLAARDLIHEKTLGRLFSVVGRLYFGRTRDVGSMLWHDGCHLFDVIHFLLDDKKLKFNLTGKTEFQWNATAKSGDTLVLVETGKGRDHLTFELDLSFEKGRVRVGNGVFEIWESRESRHYSSYRSLERVQDGWQGPTGYFSRMLEDAVFCAREGGRTPVSNAATELATLKILEKLTGKMKVRGKKKPPHRGGS